MRRRGLEPLTAAGEATQGAASEVPSPAPEPSAPQPAPEPPVPAAEPAAPQPAPEPPVDPEPVAPQPAPEPLPPAAEEPVMPKPSKSRRVEPAFEDGEPTVRRLAPQPEPVGRAVGPDLAHGGSWFDEEPPPAAEPPRQPRPAPPPRGANRPRQAPPLKGKRRRPAPPPPRAPRRPLPPSMRPPSQGGRRIVAGFVVLVVALLVLLGVKTFQPFHGDPSGSVAVTVPAGANAGDIGDLLSDAGVVDSGTFFTLNATLTGRRDGLQPGDYALQRDMSYGAALDAISKGPPPKKALPTFKVTLPEGLSIRELAPRVKEGGVKGGYVAAATSPKALKRARGLGLPSGTATTEGYLFPATYDLRRGTGAKGLVAAQLQAFEDNTADVDYRRARRANLTKYEVLVIASMVERETQLDRERPLVAAVIWNRLREGMTLGIDATIRYAEDNWTRPLLQSELDRPGPYNSRLNSGLPPTPIGNPGLASIEAAANPADVDYLFYVVKPGTNGHAFSSTDAEFAEDLQRYNEAREANGGNSPTP